MIQLGRIYKSLEGKRFRAVRKLGSSSFLVQFVDSGILRCFHKNLIEKFDVSERLYGVGYIQCQIDEYLNEYHKSNAKAVWRGMMNRCYSGRFKSYSNVKVCDEWHNFVNFAIWYKKNVVAGWSLDKDLFSKDEKIYSPESCCFIPQIINSSMRGGIALLKDAKGYYFVENSYYFCSRKIYGKTYNDTYKLFILYRQVYIKTLVSVYWKQMDDRVIEKLTHLYDEKREIFKNTRDTKRKRDKSKGLS